MKLTQAASIPVLVGLTAISCATRSLDRDSVRLDSFESRISYVIGQDIGKSLKQLDTDFDLDILMIAVEDVLKDRPLLLSDSAIRALNEEFSRSLQQKQESKRQKEEVENKQKGEAFLEENRTREGVIVTESGLQYRVIEEGEGSTPALTDKVTVHYRGRLLDGTEFDSSHKRGSPATFPVTGVIPGWTEALQLMKVGGRYELYIPSELAYGERGAGPQIGPNSTLIFEIDLIGIEN